MGYHYVNLSITDTVLRESEPDVVYKWVDDKNETSRELSESVAPEESPEQHALHLWTPVKLCCLLHDQHQRTVLEKARLVISLISPLHAFLQQVNLYHIVLIDHTDDFYTDCSITQNYKIIGLKNSFPQGSVQNIHEKLRLKNQECTWTSVLLKKTPPSVRVWFLTIATMATLRLTRIEYRLPATTQVNNQSTKNIHKHLLTD